jgi:hypothetical protein
MREAQDALGVLQAVVSRLGGQLRVGRSIYVEHSDEGHDWSISVRRTD